MVRIGVVGEGVVSESTAAAAYEVGRLLAERGVTVICGGLQGVMESAARGARDAGGRTLGILPGNSRDDANPYVDVAVVTGLGEGRNVLVVRNSDCLIAVGGGFGTLSEIALALKLGKAVIGLDTWIIQRPGDESDPIIRVRTPQEAVEKALRQVRKAKT